MAGPDNPPQEHPIPVLLLKTRSTPSDAYQDAISTAQLPNGQAMKPIFIPVLRHQFQDSGLVEIKRLLHDRQISREPGSAYGGIIFTSQRAVEAFAHIINQDKGKHKPNPDITQTPKTHTKLQLANKDTTWPHLQNIPIYSVGPATTRALAAIPQAPTPLQIFGQHTGNGEALAEYILSHYASSSWYSDRNPKPPLLFLVGETRRDIIPRTLMNPDLPADARIDVTEQVVYGTGVMESFPADFGAVLRENEALNKQQQQQRTQWVVVFSPTGCDAMLRCLDLLDEETGKAVPAEKRDGRTRVATIGPTTRDFLVDTFGFEPDVCAEKPSPEGILQGILEFEKEMT